MKTEIINIRKVYIITQDGLHTPYVFTKEKDAQTFISQDLQPNSPEKKYSISQAVLRKI